MIHYLASQLQYTKEHWQWDCTLSYTFGMYTTNKYTYISICHRI